VIRAAKMESEAGFAPAPLFAANRGYSVLSQVLVDFVRIAIRIAKVGTSD